MSGLSIDLPTEAYSEKSSGLKGTLTIWGGIYLLTLEHWSNGQEIVETAPRARYSRQHHFCVFSPQPFCTGRSTI